MDDVILVKTNGLRGVEIDVDRRVASGSKWADVVPKASELGLAALHGSTADVSVAGYSLGGGVGWYGRKHGLSTNSVLAIELVTALEVQLYPISEVYAGMVPATRRATGSSSSWPRPSLRMPTGAST